MQARIRTFVEPTARLDLVFIGLGSGAWNRWDRSYRYLLVAAICSFGSISEYMDLTIIVHVIWMQRYCMGWMETVGVCGCSIIKIHICRAIQARVMVPNGNLDDAASAISDYTIWKMLPSLPFFIHSTEVGFLYVILLI